MKLEAYPRLPVYQGKRDFADEDDLDQCFIAVHPKPHLTRRALQFLQIHYQDWTELTGEGAEADPPRLGSYQSPMRTVETVEFHYSPRINEHEQQYIVSLARWVALRVGTVRSRSVGKLSATARSQGQRREDRNRYNLPCLFYNGYEKWLVVREDTWKQELSPDEMGVGALCDEHGFRTQDDPRQRQALYHVQDLNGLVFAGVRKTRDLDRARETLIQGELKRLSALWRP